MLSYLQPPSCVLIHKCKVMRRRLIPCDLRLQDRIKAVQDERKYVIELADTAPKKKNIKAPTMPVAGIEVGDMVEKEARRLEVTKRRQARELSQMISFEVARKEQQVRALQHPLKPAKPQFTSILQVFMASL